MIDQIKIGSSFFEQCLKIAIEKAIAKGLIDKATNVIPKDITSSPSCMAETVRKLQIILNDDFMGLGDHSIPVGSFGFSIRYALHAETLGQFLNDQFHFYDTYFQAGFNLLVRDEQTAVIKINTGIKEEERSAILATYSALAAHRIACWVTGTQIPLIRISFKHDKPEWGHEYATMFSCPVTFSENCSSLTFDIKHLQNKCIRSSVDAEIFCKNHPLHIFPIPGDDYSLSSKITRLIRDEIQENNNLPSIEHIAKCLNISSQQLRFRLIKEGTSYQNIKNEVRSDIACYKLRYTELSIEDIAAFIGFSEVNSFYRAFKCWTGKSPQTYRDDHSG